MILMKKEKLKLEQRVVIRLDWLESERGWGTRPDGYSLHKTIEDCKQYIKEYWDGMPDEIPDEYSRPCGETYKVEVPMHVYKKVRESKNGVRKW